jgi:hypothetical protein
MGRPWTILCIVRRVRILLLFSFFIGCLGSVATHGAELISNQEPKPAGSPSERPLFDFYARGPFEPALPRPSSSFGYEPGSFGTTYGQYESLLKEYQEHSDRLKVFQLGKTPEHRSLYLLAISSPANLARLDEIKENVSKIADPRKLEAGPELEELFKKTPIIVWLSYSIHGSESAAFEAGIQVLYQLLASQDPALVKMLEETVVLINPCQNPDGHERFVTWYNAHGAGRPEHYAFEHSEPWSITGRLNHFFFDLNRDLISLSQIESQVATAAFLQWHPQVLADHHGQVKEYFFPPPAMPINPNLPPKISTKWLELFGRSNAAVFDRFEWSYYVRDVFDLFYPGYWDSWSSLHGATGMTYETDGGGSKGYQWLRDDGTLVSLRDGIAKHFAAGLNTVFTAAANREVRLRDYREFFVSSISGLKQKYYFLPGKDPEAAEMLVGLLRKQGIEVSRTEKETKIGNGKDSQGGEVVNQTIAAGSFVVDTAQPNGRMANALLEVETAQDADFIKRQEELRKTNESKGTEETKQEYEFYDVTAWSLPLALGVESYLTEEPIRVELTPVESVNYPKIVLRTGNGTKEEAGKASPISQGVGYAFEPGSLAAMKLAVALLQKGYRLDTSNDSIRAAGRTFPRGTFFLRTERNPANLRETLQTLSDLRGVAIQSVSTAYPDQGQRGIGSEAVFALKAPKIALLTGSPTSQSSWGLIRFLLAEKCGLDIVPIAADSLLPEVLSDFNVLILPDGTAARYTKSFDDKAVASLREFVTRGGILICLGGASQFAADPEVKLTSSRLIGEKTDSDKKPDKPEAPSASPESKKDISSQKPLWVPGAIVRATVNHRSFLTIGYETGTIPLLIQGNAFYKPTDTGENALTFEESKLKISGFFWKDNSEELLRGTSALIDEPMERGHVILFNTEPGFRMIWYSTVRLLLNAIVYGPSQLQDED